MSHISNGSATEIIPSTKNIVCIIWMIGPVRNNSQPKIPIKSFGNRRSICRVGCPLRPYRAIRPVMNFTQRSDLSFIDPFFYQCHFRFVCSRQASEYLLLSLLPFHCQACFIHPVGNWFMYHHMLSFFHCSNGNISMQMIRRHDLYRINTLFFFKQFTEISIRITCLYNLQHFSLL